MPTVIYGGLLLMTCARIEPDVQREEFLPEQCFCRSYKKMPYNKLLINLERYRSVNTIKPQFDVYSTDITLG